jgi:4a-hydroxytetrahydrobiopterin dehydratase
MEKLTEIDCVPCRGDEPPASEDEIAEYRQQVPEWEIVERNGVKRLKHSYDFDDFAEALGFTNRVGEIAEDAGHHPAILTEWGEVTVTWWTHKIGGLHRNDFVMAAKTDKLYQDS